MRSQSKRIPITKALGSASEDKFAEHAVVGVYASGSNNRFVRHVALLASEANVSANAEVAVLHMGPPIVAGAESASAPGAARTVHVHIVGDLALTIGERNAMKNWFAKVDKQQRPRQLFQQYVVKPPMKWEHSEKGRKLFQRFSCVGFVLECYSAAGIEVIDSDAEFPEVDEQILRSAYPDIFKVEGTDKRVQDRLGFKGRGDLGVGGNGPWRIALAGYVFHSLERASTDSPRPQPFSPASISDACYP